MVLPAHVLGAGYYEGLQRFHDPQRVQVSFATWGEPEAWPHRTGADAPKVLALRVRGRSGVPRAIVRLARFVRKERIDLLHGHLFWPSLVAWGAARRTSRPVVMSRLYSDLLEIEGRHLRARLEVWLARRMDRVISVSDYMTRYLVEREGLDAAAIETLKLGVLLDRFPDISPADRTAYRQRFDPQVAFLVGCAGRLVREKGYDYALKAWAQVAAKVPHARLVLAGSGPLEAELKHLARELGVEGTVTFLGPLGAPEMATFYSSLDAFLHPSLSEGLGQVTIEAMACGVPCIAFNLGPMPEVVRDGETGILVRKGDVNGLAGALQRLHDDTSLRRAMGAAARARARNEFDVKDMTARLETLYDRVVTGRGPAKVRP